MSAFGVENVPLPTPGAFGSFAPQHQTHELVQGMNAPSWLLHLSSHRSLPPFFPSLQADKHERLQPFARRVTQQRHDAPLQSGATQSLRLYLRGSNLFRQCPMEMWAHGGWRHHGSSRGFSQVMFLKCGSVRKELNEDNELGKKLKLRVAQIGLVKMILSWLPPFHSPIWLHVTHASPPPTCC